MRSTWVGVIDTQMDSHNVFAIPCQMRLFLDWKYTLADKQTLVLSMFLITREAEAVDRSNGVRRLP